VAEVSRWRDLPADSTTGKLDRALSRLSPAKPRRSGGGTP
jgi:hypothetical protein